MFQEQLTSARGPMWSKRGLRAPGRLGSWRRRTWRFAARTAASDDSSVCTRAAYFVVVVSSVVMRLVGVGSSGHRALGWHEAGVPALR